MTEVGQSGGIRYNVGQARSWSKYIRLGQTAQTLRDKWGQDMNLKRQGSQQHNLKTGVTNKKTWECNQLLGRKVLCSHVWSQLCCWEMKLCEVQDVTLCLKPHPGYCLCTDVDGRLESNMSRKNNNPAVHNSDQHDQFADFIFFLSQISLCWLVVSCFPQFSSTCRTAEVAWTPAVNVNVKQNNR